MFGGIKKCVYICSTRFRRASRRTAYQGGPLKLLESSHQLPAEQPTRWDFSFIQQLICNTLNKPLP